LITLHKLGSGQAGWSELPVLEVEPCAAFWTLGSWWWSLRPCFPAPKSGRTRR